MEDLVLFLSEQDFHFKVRLYPDNTKIVYSYEKVGYNIHFESMFVMTKFLLEEL
jgi:hypothetical protein